MTTPTPKHHYLLPSMEAHSKPQRETKPTSFTAVNSYLQTPEEPITDSFSQEEPATRASKEQPTGRASQGWQLPPIMQTASPPASPLPSIASATGIAVDVPLYPESQPDRQHSQAPLFEREPSPSAPQQQSVAPNAPEADASQPEAADSPNALRSPWTGIAVPHEALEYYHSCVNQLRVVPRVRGRLPAPTKSRSPERDAISQQQVSRLGRPSGVTKSRSQPKDLPSRSRAPKAPTATSPVSARATPSPRKRTPKPRTQSDFLNEAFPKEQSKHKRAPPSKKVADSGVHWRDLPDYSPPLSDLDENSKQLKVTWDAKWLDITPMEYYHDLHPQEQTIAASLRLEPWKYMYNKRKIFMGRLQALRDGKNFTKTAAQGACDIDVNKASRLWETFDRVGWFEEHWFKRFL
jgi:hypothetical protein